MRVMGVILSLVLLSTPVFAQPPSLCFTIGDAQKILRQVEKDLPDCRRELYANKLALDNGASEALRECRSTSDLYRERVMELTRERDQCVSLLDNTVKAGEDAVKAARGPWYKRAFAVGKWIAVGAVGTVVASFVLRQ